MTLSVILSGIVGLHALLVSIPGEPVDAIFTECADGVDNDLDGKIDYPQDDQCFALEDNSEGPTGRGLFISLTDKAEKVIAGDSVTYTVGLRTERDETQLIHVRFLMPHQTNLISASDGGRLVGEYVQWDNVSVHPGSLRNLYVNISVNPHANEGLLMVAEVVANGEKAVDTTLVYEQPTPIPHMEISITDGREFVEPGDRLTYRIVVKNTASVGRTFELHAQIPSETFYVDARGNPLVTRQSVIWQKQFLRSQESREYFFTLQTSREIPELGVVRARVSVPGATAVDSTSIYTGILPTGFSVSVTDGLQETAPGELVTYAIVVNNGTSKLATEVEITHALPSYVEFVTATDGGYWTGKNVRWKGLTISPFGARTLNVTGRIRRDAPLGTKLQSRVMVQGNEAVDRTDVSGEVIGRAVVAQRGSEVLVRKTADTSEVEPGSTVRFGISVQNVTNRPLRNIRISDRMDANHLRVLGAHGGEMRDGAITWFVPELQSGETWKTNYTVAVDPRTPHGSILSNIVTVSAEGLEAVSLTERIVAGKIGVVAAHPPTGAAFDLLFLGLTSTLGAIQTAAAQRRKRGTFARLARSNV